jgi:hypothetical protein
MTDTMTPNGSAPTVAESEVERLTRQVAELRAERAADRIEVGALRDELRTQSRRHRRSRGHRRVFSRGAPRGEGQRCRRKLAVRAGRFFLSSAPIRSSGARPRSRPDPDQQDHFLTHGLVLVPDATKTAKGNPRTRYPR